MKKYVLTHVWQEQKSNVKMLFKKINFHDNNIWKRHFLMVLAGLGQLLCCSALFLAGPVSSPELVS